MSNNSTNGESAVSRVTKLPVVESTLNVASNMYSRVKDSNSMITSVFNTAENAVTSAKEAVQPITMKFEGQIKTVDSYVCSGLDYVENKIPQIKLPPHELYESAKNTVLTTVEPAVKCVCQGVQKVKDLTGFSATTETVEPCAAGDQCINSKKAKPVVKPETPPNDGNTKKGKPVVKPETPANDGMTWSLTPRPPRLTPTARLLMPTPTSRPTPTYKATPSLPYSD